MAKVKWSNGIDYISGALNKVKKGGQHDHEKMLLATHRVAPTTSQNCNRVYLREAPKRSTPPTADEIERRSRFASIATAVAARMKNLSTITADQAAFYAQKENGIPTFKAYIWSLEKARYDEQHG